jgi:hypothetical protein
MARAASAFGMPENRQLWVLSMTVNIRPRAAEALALVDFVNSSTRSPGQLVDRKKSKAEFSLSLGVPRGTRACMQVHRSAN